MDVVNFIFVSRKMDVVNFIFVSCKLLQVNGDFTCTHRLSSLSVWQSGLLEVVTLFLWQWKFTPKSGLIIWLHLFLAYKIMIYSCSIVLVYMIGILIFVALWTWVWIRRAKFWKYYTAFFKLCNGVLLCNNIYYLYLHQAMIYVPSYVTCLWLSYQSDDEIYYSFLMMHQIYDVSCHCFCRRQAEEPFGL
jgi:hypothetical protein